MKNKLVDLLGVGHGDAGLITLKAVKCLKKVNCIIYDYLINAQLINCTKEGAEKIHIGKQGSAHTKTQSEINSLIIKKAKSWKIGARVKGGDSFIFAVVEKRLKF